LNRGCLLWPGLPLRKTLFAINRTFPGGFERHFAILMAIGANGLMEDPLPATVTGSRFCGTLRRTRTLNRLGNRDLNLERLDLNRSLPSHQGIHLRTERQELLLDLRHKTGNVVFGFPFC